MNERVRPTGIYGGQTLEGFTVVSGRGGFRLITITQPMFLSTGSSNFPIHQPGESMGLLLALTYAVAGS